ncbi:MAG: family 1 glycosylhydrolase [Saprospiraceae bacterium]
MSTKTGHQFNFPPDFFWGTSTAFAQVETASAHSWRGTKALDGAVFERTTDHEKHRLEDADLISRFGTIYRCSVDWARLQTQAFAEFDQEVIREYQELFVKLESKGMQLMFVFHHFAHPIWFEEKGAFSNEDNLPAFLDYAEKCIRYFGKYAGYWNTFNEPNVYALNAYVLGNFPPKKKGKLWVANRALRNMGRAHDILFHLIRQKSDAPIGISLNTASFKGTNLLGNLVAAYVRRWFIHRAAWTFDQVDFWGLSYYAHVLFNPFPIDAISQKDFLEKNQLPHDDMWIYRPEGLAEILEDFHEQFRKPIIITENGLCTSDQEKRISAIKDYLEVCHAAIEKGIDLKGYIHWSTLDNFEWHLGPSYRFGLVEVNFDTMERKMTKAGEFYEKITRENGFPS